MADSDERKTQIKINLTESEREVVDAARVADHFPNRSAYARHLLLAHAQRKERGEKQ